MLYEQSIHNIYLDKSILNVSLTSTGFMYQIIFMEEKQSDDTVLVPLAYPNDLWCCDCLMN